MFETAELGRKVPKTDYKARALTLRQELLELQQKLRHAHFPVIILFAGVDGAGKGETVNLLNEWMDPRWLIAHAYSEPSEEESERPPFWRYWRDLPPQGRIGFFLSAWYSQPLLDRVYDRINEAEFDEQLGRIVNFERELVVDGALILKFWMHLGKAAQKKRLRSLEKDPALKWRVTETDWQNWHHYDGFVSVAERVILRTSTGGAPWHIVEGSDPGYRSLTVGTTIRDAVERQLMQSELERRMASELKSASVDDTEDDRGEADDLVGTPRIDARKTILSTLDMTQSLDKGTYQTALKKGQGRLLQLQRLAKERKVSSLLVMEGWDAAGKGGAARRITAALDARDYQVIPFAAPTDEERAHHYLWRFWRHLGRAGRVTIFDRSWYGRVLVERIEGFASQDEWMRAYAEIVDFEAQLVEHGIVLVKYWLHITSEEQLERFNSRQATPHKSWKLTEEDWRNRERWSDYEIAVHDMIERTSTRQAPWTLVEGNDKLVARVKVLDTFCDRLEARLQTDD